MAFSKPEFSTNIPFSVLEYQDTSLEDLDCEFELGLVLGNHFECGEILAPTLRELDVGFLTGGVTAVEMIYFTVLLELMQDD